MLEGGGWTAPFFMVSIFQTETLPSILTKADLGAPTTISQSQPCNQFVISEANTLLPKRKEK